MLEPYGLPHECEGAELAALLAGLTPRQRRALRAYVWQVELGEQTVTAWLASPMCPVSRSIWYRGDAGARYWGNAAFQQVLTVYRRAGLKWATSQDQRSVEQAQRRIRRASSGAAERLVEQAQGDIGTLFRLAERWTDEPLPSEEILAEEDREDADGIKRKFYRVRQAVLDLQRLSDPRYSRLIKKFSDSPRSGLSIEVYDAQRAAESVLDRAGMETASKATTSVELGERFEEALHRAYGGEVGADHDPPLRDAGTDETRWE
jgi:hypothetical protein